MLAELSAANRNIDGLMLQAIDGTSYKPYYVTRIQFE
jgi:hypothetical protein